MAAPRPKAASASAAAQRNAALAKIHVARKDLAMHEDSYRAMLLRVTRQESAGRCDLAQLDAVLAEFRRLGWQERKGKRGGRPTAGNQVELIQALWDSMAKLVEDPSQDALRAFCARQTKTAANPLGVSAPEFLKADQANKVIEGLKAWRGRLLSARKAALRGRRKGHAA